MNVTVLGAGGWGTALSILLHDNAAKTTLWAYKKEYAEELSRLRENRTYLHGVTIPGEIEITADIEKAVDSADVVVASIPSQYLREQLKKIADFDFHKKLFVNTAKGIEASTLLTMSEVVQATLKKCPIENYVVLSGPSHAEEVSRRMPTAIVAASHHKKSAELVQKTFMNKYFRVYLNRDVKGVELCGALKNVIALAAGMSDGAGYGDNTKAALMTRGMVEITRLGETLGAHHKTFSGLAGMGDLIVTCMSRYSRNRFVGEQVAAGRKLEEVLDEIKMVAEGVPTAKAANQLAEKYGVEMPIMEQVYNVLFNGKDPQVAVRDLMMRPAKDEY
ncbi:MAG: NAD(P)H-dependent glycerol-3-phosphate dehydrogenase [Bacteroidetes bacterium]|nr:NAD(P)H-dependent glycerol-3-phosphate dehydrogenase [Bacteroidota bacterium]MCL5737514.1 NAD(P)H-dependent glycerol-3-phosphate dehydrogenase [Bacteroidota bacterium]